MEVAQPRQRMNLRLCQTFNCTANASGICLTDEVFVCNMCTAVFHYDCDVNIKDGEGFIYHTLETLKSLVEIMKDRGMKTCIDRLVINFRDGIIHIQDNIKALEDEISKNLIIGSKNVDKFVKKTKELTKSIMESHIYSVYTDYILKLKICEIVPSKLDDSGEMGLYSIRTQFYLDAKKKEMEFKENKLKALAQEMDARVTQAKQQSDQKFAVVESRITQEAELAKSGIEELKQLMLGMFEEIRKEQRLKFEEFSSILKVQKEEANKSHTLNEEHKEELKSNLKDHKQKIDSIEKKQEEMEKNIDVTHKSTEKRQTKQDEKVDELKKKIEDLTKDSSNSIVKMESSIEDISQKIKSTKEDLKNKIDSSNEDLKKDIKSSNEVLNKDIDSTKENLKKEIENSSEVLKKDFESKIGAAELSLQKDLDEKQNDCSKLVKEYSEEFKMNYSELKQTVDTIQENLKPLFYIRTQPQSTHSLFRDRFTKASGAYKRLGQFDYGQPSCTTDHIKTCIGKYNEWIYIGEVKEGTHDTPHGIGITVDRYGDIAEGYWKDGKQHGRGRYIYNYGEYYIGELEGGCKNGEGTMYRSNGYKEYEGGWENGRYNGQGTHYCYNGDIQYEGGWKNSSRYGQGTYYKHNGDKYTGIWDCLKGQGEVNYKDGKKYKGQWDGNYWNIKRHGLGTLYSADGQVLNQGKWEWSKYKGKE